jgi:hypothetical protein
MRAYWTAVSGLLFVTFTGGCGTVVRRADVSRQFQADFRCAGAQVSGAFGSYTASGCGQRVTYACVSAPRNRAPLAGDGSVLAQIVGDLLVGDAVGSACVVSHVRQVPQVQLPPSDAAAPPAHIARSGALKQRILFAGGYISLVARPQTHPEHVLMRLHATQRLPEGACQSALYADAGSLAIAREERVGPYDALILVGLADLASLRGSTSLAGSLCGTQVTLDAAACQTITRYVAQFQQAAARADANRAEASRD